MQSLPSRLFMALAISSALIHFNQLKKTSEYPAITQSRALAAPGMSGTTPRPNENAAGMRMHAMQMMMQRLMG
ncbi:hypothetical protein COO60DRAFT_1495178, partial [Scenedesmus sp. NREL 46B-D3]